MYLFLCYSFFVSLCDDDGLNNQASMKTKKKRRHTLIKSCGKTFCFFFFLLRFMYFVYAAYINNRTFCRKGSLEKKLVGNYKKKASCTHQNLRKNVYKENTRALDDFSLKVFKCYTHARLGILCIYTQLHTHIYTHTRAAAVRPRVMRNFSPYFNLLNWNQTRYGWRECECIQRGS